MMKINYLFAAFASVCCFVVLAGCSSKTPEEIEAAKYPMAKPLTKAEQQALDQRMAKYRTPPSGAPARPDK